MLHLRRYARGRRPSDPVPHVTLAPRFPLAERFLNDEASHERIDFVTRLVRTAPGDVRNRMLKGYLSALGCRLPSTLTTSRRPS